VVAGNIGGLILSRSVCNLLIYVVNPSIFLVIGSFSPFNFLNSGRFFSKASHSASEMSEASNIIIDFLPLSAAFFLASSAAFFLASVAALKVA
jgi:hypothetical protein